ncbi:MAG TPA: FAD-binding oxidoreductase [Candidatus Omnitrophota bacterium]|nr:FAD-binding oxidoreductase [Candidatus Omnitrophota bacterium]
MENLNRKNRVFEALVIGGGVAGLSTAYALARKGLGDILVIEGEAALGGHSSGRNAGMIRQAIAEPVLAKLAKKGRARLARLSKKSWNDLGFRANGSLILASGKGLQELRATEKVLRALDIACDRVTKAQAERKVPVLRGADFKEGIFCPSDALIRIDALLKGFLKALRSYGVSVLFGRHVESIRKTGACFEVKTDRGTFTARRIVNAAGAAASLIAHQAGASVLPLTPYRRHLFKSRPYAETVKHWPFVWDVEHNLYFRPVGKALLLSPCDRMAVSGRYAARGREKFDARMRALLLRKIKTFRAAFRGLKIEEGKSGLRTMAPDGRFVIGEDPKLKGFFWVAGLGGHGVTTCFPVGELAGDLILGREHDRAMARALSPKRFRKGHDDAS